MESRREDGTVITELVEMQESEARQSYDVANTDNIFGDGGGPPVGRVSFETGSGRFLKVEDVDRSSDEDAEADAAVFGDDWIGKPGVSSSSEEEDIPIETAPSNSKRKRNRTEGIPSNISMVEGDPAKYKCTVCVKVFGSKGHIRYHAYCARQEKPFKCHLCPKHFSKKAALTYHIKTHTGERPFVCTMCDKTFIQSDKLKRHETTHVGNKFECDLCNKKFRDTYSLNVHKKTHTDPNCNVYKCDTCSKSFKGKSSLNKHVKGVHSDSKQYFCEHCGKGFDWKFNLVCHIRTHSGVRAYRCDKCSRTFKNHNDLCKHRLAHTDKRQYRCRVCKGDFKRRDNLLRHLKNIHPESPVDNIIKISSQDSEPEPTTSTEATDNITRNSTISVIAKSNSEDIGTVKTRNDALAKESSIPSRVLRIPGEYNSIPGFIIRNPGECTGSPSNTSRIESHGIPDCIYRIPGESSRVPTIINKTPGESSRIPSDSNRTVNELARIVSHSNKSRNDSHSSIGDRRSNLSFRIPPQRCSDPVRANRWRAGQSSASDRTRTNSEMVSGDSNGNSYSYRISVIKNLAPSYSSGEAQQSVIKHSRESEVSPERPNPDSFRDCVIKSTRH